MANLSSDWRELLADIRGLIKREARSVVAPFTRGGKLDFSTPNAVGRIPWTRVGDGSGVPPGGAVPDPFVYLTDDSGEYLRDQDGAYLFEYL